MRSIALVLCVVAAGCQNSPTTPTGSGYAGEWSGTTAQGAVIAFSLSRDEKVTAITIGHSFGSCTGSQTFQNLSLNIAPDVTCIPGPCGPGIASYRAFHYGTGAPGGPLTSINGLFLSNSRAEGTVNFGDYPGCGTVVGVGWTATRR